MNGKLFNKNVVISFLILCLTFILSSSITELWSKRLHSFELRFESLLEIPKMLSLINLLTFNKYTNNIQIEYVDNTNIEMKQYGENGTGVDLPQNLNETIQQEIDKGWKQYAYNKYVSDLIGFNRSLPDYRDDWCKEPNRVSSKLPKTDIIICYRNEALSVLQRTIHSILRYSPQNLLNEIILVDDFSDDNTNDIIENYWKHEPKIKLIRNDKNEGLIRARLIGLSQSTAEVVTFLDSHCECTEGWLEPLLDRIVRNNRTVAIPTLDYIDAENLSYKGSALDEIYIVTFTWNLLFLWDHVPQRIRDKQTHLAEPFATPAMNGGIFSINREFFNFLGTYDPNLNTWGGENMELSFKAWMCHGDLQVVPCSHVGHLFRKVINPWDWWNVDFNHIYSNIVRVAEVWLDDAHKEYFYMTYGKTPTEPDSELIKRKEMRKRMQCNSFQWYLDNVAPEIVSPKNTIAHGGIQSLLYKEQEQLCLDSIDFQTTNISLVKCHNQYGNQNWLYTTKGEIRKICTTCLDYFGEDIHLMKCHSSFGNQQWQYDYETNQIVHTFTNKCLSIDVKERKVIMERCDTFSKNQKWSFQHFKQQHIPLE